MTEEQERRACRRKEKEFPVYFMSAESDTWTKGTGFTENIAPGGVYFRPQHCSDWNELEVGQKLKLRVSGIRYDGTIIRLENQEGSSEEELPGIAVRFDGCPVFGSAAASSWSG